MSDVSAPDASAVAASASVEPPLRLRLDLAYDGSAFSGWAAQPQRRTVQGVLEEAIGRLFGGRLTPLTLTVAGRTDAGVHAGAQVAHLDLLTEHRDALARARRGTAGPQGAAAGLLRGLNGVLGTRSDVVVTAVRPAPAGFDARFSASWRRYRYRIADRLSGRDPLQRHRTVWHGRELDLDRLQQAAQAALGLHDFLAFCKPREGATTIRTLQDFRWWRSDAEPGVVVAELRADAFCHSMVRSLVGAAVAVGEGKREPAEIAELLANPRREPFAAVMPAAGLELCEIGYPDDAELAVRAEQTRARRTLRLPRIQDPGSE